MIKKCIASALVLLIMAVPGLAADNPYGYYDKDSEHTFEQDVEGTGYAMAYQKVNTKTLQLMNYMHGSGDFDTATLIYSNQSKKKVYPPKKASYYQYMSDICFVEQSETDYYPLSFAYGTGFYAQNPVVYNSKMKEKTYGKSYQEGVSMHHQIEYAQGFVKDIMVDLDCNESTEVGEYGNGFARMKIDEEVTQGMVDIGELITKSDGSYGVKKPLVTIDEKYVGDFAIMKDMKYNAVKDKDYDSTPKDWLSCCFGGYADMDSRYYYDTDKKRWIGDTIGIENSAGIFTCGCYKEALAGYDPAWGGDPDYCNQTAQFPENYEGECCCK